MTSPNLTQQIRTFVWENYDVYDFLLARRTILLDGTLKDDVVLPLRVADAELRPALRPHNIARLVELGIIPNE